jgi:hypothetical protein
MRSIGLRTLAVLVLLVALVGVSVAQGPGMATASPVGEPAAVPAAPSPEDVLWDQYANFSGTNIAAQDFETAYDIYDVWAGDNFENLDGWVVDTIVTRGGWTGFVDLNNATAIHWYICADNGGVPGCVPGDGSEYWEIHLAPSDPQVGLGVFEPEDIVLTLDTPIDLPAGTWWLIQQVSLEFALYGQWGVSSTSDPVWGSPAMQINPNGGFGYGPDWFVNTNGYDMMFRLEGTVGAADTMHVGGIKGRPYAASILKAWVLVEDQGQAPLDGAQVYASVWAPNWGPRPVMRMTMANGLARFAWGSIASGTWTLCVDDIVLAGYTYVPGDNVVTCMDWVY